jgi:hypothetical protein
MSLFKKFYWGLLIAIVGFLLGNYFFGTIPPWWTRIFKQSEIKNPYVPPPVSQGGLIKPEETLLKTVTPKDYVLYLLPEDQNMPTNPIIKKGMGPAEEFSRSSREKTVYAITNFIANAKRAGLKFDAGDLVMPIRVRTAVNSSATAQTERVVFGAEFSPSRNVTPAVDYITSIGRDENGANRNYYSLNPGGTSLTLLMDQNLYPIKSTTNDVYPALMNFLTLQIPDGNYVLNDVYRPQGPLPLPILVYQFVPPDEYKKVDPYNYINITLRIGGKDLAPGEAELIAYEDSGIFIRANHETKSFPKPSPSLLGKH